MDSVPDIAIRARAHLNDQGDQIFHTDLLLEFINDAFEEIQEELVLRNIPALQEVTASIPVAANTPTTISRIQIPDLFYPLSLQEYPTGSSEDPTDMTKLQWDSDIEVSDKILYWTWREGDIKIPQVTRATSVIVKYNRLYLELDNDDTILLIGTKRFLGYRTAELAAGTTGGRAELVTYLNAKAEQAKDIFVSNSVKQIQKFGARHKPFRRQFVR